VKNVRQEANMFDNRFSRFNRRETLTMLGAFAVNSAVGAPDSSLRLSSPETRTRRSATAEAGTLAGLGA
jgi:hypothetical protein